MREARLEALARGLAMPVAVPIMALVMAVGSFVFTLLEAGESALDDLRYALRG